jgi:hypothetical protein
MPSRNRRFYPSASGCFSARRSDKAKCGFSANGNVRLATFAERRALLPQGASIHGISPHSLSAQSRFCPQLCAMLVNGLFSLALVHGTRVKKPG